ncbi:MULTISPECIES: hypothetical protein [unclassified Bacillus (in: firmicutes)]|uniref:hypothetical protein n=1 Tax=unclassified Bacillus (in: firmicutes) TaxID=185979 RepID=UPI001480DE8F|nr:MULTISPECIES: hypothetical protein [unclassified Bacillus (in: firmicutes)]
MMLEPNERNITIDEQEKQIQDILDNKISTNSNFIFQNAFATYRSVTLFIRLR